VIVAVFGIMAFLVAVVIPLFTGGRVESEVTRPLAIADKRIIAASVDDHHTFALTIIDDGRVEGFHVATGRRIQTPQFDLAGQRIMSIARSVDGRDLAFGFADGNVRFGTLAISAVVVPASDVPSNLDRLDARDRTDGTAIYTALPGAQFRRSTVALTLDPPQRVAPPGTAILDIDLHVGGTSERPTRSFVTLDATGAIRLSRSESRMNLMTRRMRTTLETADLPALPAGVKAIAAITTDKADQVYAVDTSGTIHRFDTRDFKAPQQVESLRPIAEGGRLTAFGFLLGEQSLVVGGSDGSVDVYFRLPREEARTQDGFALVRAHRLERQEAAITGYAPSQRSKLFVTADAKGNIWVRHSTSAQTSLKLKLPDDSAPLRALAFAPREDGVFAVDAQGRGRFWKIAVPHPETTLATIFGKVWYEGYSEPSFTWQSSAGTDSFEPKLSLVPLIFGTIKATFYALLFAVPIALLAAIFTAEFMHPRVRATLKPVMEMMASLPSVVLGFIAALILAPIVENSIASVLMIFVALPVTLIAAALLWQALPRDAATRLEGVPRLLAMFVALAFAIVLCWIAGSVFERIVFAGDVKAWANGTHGSSFPFLTLLMTPPSYLAVFLLLRRFVGDRLLDAARSRTGFAAARFDAMRWSASTVVALMLAALIAGLFTAGGYDPRGSFIGTYVQRNTLVVGFAMGFAVIPIIYTIAEDALSAVPEHLRAASLACGATPWQTATRVILPTAVSGVFAAVMIGMGRAVGETMIVVMAAGNTPILDWNVFNGLRALSANIAVELPEAVRDSTLYRMLFLAALVLFVMTFAVNTAAEVIRQRFRRRAVQL
jgi:phosphate transport system permease protein